MTNNYCSNCGEPAGNPDAKACANCGKPYAGLEKENASAEKIVYVKEKSTYAAIILSFLSPGAGQAYNGRMKKGIFLLFVYWIGIFFMLIPSFIAWMYSIYDAYKEADRMNKGELPFAEATSKDAVLYIIAYYALVTIFCIIFMAIFMLPFMLFGY